MPPRRDLTPEQALERLARRREQTRLAVQRHRERKKAVSLTVSLTAPSSTHVRTSRSPEGSPTENQIIPLDDVERIALTLAPFASRGYVHREGFWALMAERFPLVDLVVEADGIAAWLNGPKGRGRDCTEPFLRNWIKKEAARHAAPPAVSEQALRQAILAADRPPRRKPVGTQILEMYGYAAGD